jgi:hypothetical protein
MGVRSLVVVPKESGVTASSVTTPVVGRITGIESPGRVLVEYEGATHPVAARHITAIAQKELQDAAAQARSVLLVFDRGDVQLPIIIGVLADDTTVADGHADLTAPSSAPAKHIEGPTLVTSVDGKRVKVSAEEEIVLECGEASITLRRNGRLIIRGAYVETRSRGTNRIRGGTVRIN